MSLHDNHKSTLYNKFLIGYIIIKCCIIVLQGLIINYLYHLDNNNCICAMDYRRIYIIVFLIIILISTILNGIPCILKYLANHKTLFYSIFWCIIILKVINIVFIFQYIKLLKDRKCECSESVYRDILYVINILDISVISLGVMLIGLIVLFGIFTRLYLLSK